MRVSRVLLVALAWSLVEAAPVAAEAARPYDFRGDGRQALVTGLPLSGMHNAGAVAIWSGDRWRRLVQGSPGVPGRSEAEDMFGWSVASADFDADGFADLAVSATGERVPGRRRRSGAMWIFRGSARALPSANRRSADDARSANS